MTYFSHKLKPAGKTATQATTYMAAKGKNVRDLPQLLTPDFCQINENYIPLTDGGLAKRKGLIKIAEIAGNKAGTMIAEWKGYFIFGYDKTVAALNISTLAVTTIKSNWTTNDPFSGGSYGDFFFVGNLGDKVHYITETAGVFTITEIAGAPKSGVIRPIGPRLYAGVENAVYYCSIDDGTDPPFQTWTVATTATAGGKVSFRNAGTITEICSLGDIIVAFGDTGKWAFRITTQNDGTGTIVKLDEVVIDRVDMGGASGAKTTPKGLFYVNSTGLWQVISLGQPNIPFSDQEGLTSVLLGTKYWDDVDLTNCDMVYHAKFNTLLVTCAKASISNNHIVTYNTENKAFATFKNWNINRFTKIDGDIYGISSVKTAIYHCLAGSDDDGITIGTEYKQELKTGDLETRQSIFGEYIQGDLHSLSNIKVNFDIYNVRGVLELNKIKLEWTPTANYNTLDGFGTAEYGKSGFGGDDDQSGLVSSFAGARAYIRNYQRIILHIKSSDKFPHSLNWVKMDTQVKGKIRNRQLTQII